MHHTSPASYQAFKYEGFSYASLCLIVRPSVLVILKSTLPAPWAYLFSSCSTCLSGPVMPAAFKASSFDGGPGKLASRPLRQLWQLCRSAATSKT